MKESVKANGNANPRLLLKGDGALTWIVPTGLFADARRALALSDHPSFVPFGRLRDRHLASLYGEEAKATS